MPEPAGIPKSVEPPPESAAALIATFCRATAARWEPGRPAASTGEPHDVLRAALRALTTRADALAGGVPDGPRSARLLAETARAIDAVVYAPAPAGTPAAPVHPFLERPDGLAPAAHLRLARMERWLAARAAADPDAEPAADLCLLVLERLEADASPDPGPPTPP